MNQFLAKRILDVLPSFCWQSVPEIHGMMCAAGMKGIRPITTHEALIGLVENGRVVATQSGGRHFRWKYRKTL